MDINERNEAADFLAETSVLFNLLEARTSGLQDRPADDTVRRDAEKALASLSEMRQKSQAVLDHFARIH